MIHITAHALTRARERLPGFQDMTDDQVRQALRTPALTKAVQFGACCVVLGTGHRLLIRDRCVVTVLPDDFNPKRLAKEEL